MAGNSLFADSDLSASTSAGQGRDAQFARGGLSASSRTDFDNVIRAAKSQLSVGSRTDFDNTARLAATRVGSSVRVPAIFYGIGAANAPLLLSPLL